MTNRINPSAFSLLRPNFRLVGFLGLLCLATGSALLPAQQTGGNQLNNHPRRLGTNLKGFGIPFSISDPEKKFVEVQLFMSANRGLSWQFYARQNLDAKEIPFQTNRDGEFWFALKTLDRNRQLQPPGAARPELIVVVDTLLPNVDFRVQSDSVGRVVCRWKADDQNIDPASVRLSYRPLLAANDLENVWIDVPYKAVETAQNGTFSDQYAFWAESTAQEMVVRLKIADIGGNEAVLERQITTPRISRNGFRSVGDAVPTQSASHTTQRPVNSPKSNPGPGSPSEAPRKTQSNCPDGTCEAKSESSTPGWNARQASARQASAAAKKPPASLPGASFAPPVNQVSQSAPPMPESAVQPANAATSEPDLKWHNSANLYGRTTSANVNPILDKPATNSSSKSVTWESHNVSADGRDNRQSETWPVNNAQRPVMIWNEGSTVPSQFDSLHHPRPEDSSDPKSPADDREEIPISKHKAAESENISDARPAPMLLAADTPNASGNGPPKMLQPPEQSTRELTKSNSTDTLTDSAASNHIAARPISNFEKPIGAPNNSRPLEEPPTETSVLNSPIPATLPIASPAMSEHNFNIQSVNSKRFRLNYENSYLEPDAVKSVVLWMTADGGQNWSSYGEDPDCASPFAVQVESEGTYGFRVVFESKDGVVGRNPARGDEPDMWIRVDVTTPEVQLLSAPFGRGPDAGTLVVHWKASDDDIGERPIRLSWSRLAEGPWTTIVQGLPNSGKYAWRAGSDIPEKVYLQLEVTDAAGNQSHTETTRAVDLGGLIPRGRILSVDPVK